MDEGLISDFRAVFKLSDLWFDGFDGHSMEK